MFLRQNGPFVEISDFLAKLITKVVLDSINYPIVIDSKLFKIKTVRKTQKPYNLIRRLYEFLYFITFFLLFILLLFYFFLLFLLMCVRCLKCVCYGGEVQKDIFTKALLNIDQFCSKTALGSKITQYAKIWVQ